MIHAVFVQSSRALLFDAKRQAIQPRTERNGRKRGGGVGDDDDDDDDDDASDDGRRVIIQAVVRCWRQ